MAGRRRATDLLGLVAACLVAAAPAGAQALYRIVGPDGRVTYTDRPPSAGATGSARAIPTPARSAASGPTESATGPVADARAMAGWPAPLRAAATRFPVTLYAAEDCPPCDEARRLLQRRGVPYAEKRVRTEQDAKLLQQLTGGRLVPAATIGRQALGGFQEQEWQGWLDSAGYPRTPALPAGWQPAAATALAAPGQAASAPGPAASPAVSRPPPLPLPEPGPGPGGIRF